MAKDRDDVASAPSGGEKPFVRPIGTRMLRVPAGAGAKFDADTTEELQKRLDEFDAVRTRGEVESRSVHLGGQPPR